MIFIRDGTRVYRLLMLLACVGEFPMDSVPLLGNQRIWKRLIRQLGKFQDFAFLDGKGRLRAQLLSVSGKGKKRTIRLHKSMLPILEWVEPDAYEYYRENFDDHHFSGDVTHVSRNHRVAEVVAMCQAAGILVFPWEKPDLHNRDVRLQQVDQPICYLSREIKCFFDEEELKKTQFTRLAGAIVYPHGIYPVYNTRQEAMLWRGSGEEKVQILLADIFRDYGFRKDWKHAILFGMDSRVAAHTLQSAFARRHLRERLDKIYPHVHFIPLNGDGVKMLQLLTIDNWNERLRKALYADATPSPYSKAPEHDVSSEGTYYLSHLDGDLCRLILFRRSLRTQPRASYVLDCYPFQITYVREYLGDYYDQDNLEVRLLDLDALHTHFCEEYSS